MSICIDEMEHLRLYNREIYLPVNDDRRKHGSLVALMTPNLTSSKMLMEDPRFKGKINFQSYYIERDISYYIQNESNSMSRITDHLILEDTGLEVVPSVKGTLSEFNRIDISIDTIQEHFNEYENMEIR